MSRFQRWFLRKLVRFCCVQGEQFYRIRQFFFIVIDETNLSFSEDNLPTTKSFLSENFDVAYEEVVNVQGLRWKRDCGIQAQRQLNELEK